MVYIKTHLRIVAALLMREMSARFGNKPGGYIWALLDPAAHVMLMTVIFSAIAHAPPLGSSFPLFFATGYIGFQFYLATLSQVSGALKANKSLLSYPNVAPIDTVVARYILQMGTTILVGVIVFSVIGGTLHTPLRPAWGFIIEAALLGSLLALGASLVNTVLFLKYPLYESVFHIVSRPLFLLSGVVFLPEALPNPFREIILLNPVIHVVTLFRRGFYPEYRATSFSPEYLYSWVFCALFAGMILFTFSTRTLRNE
ncbi:ABC transporter permease [Ciceribacter sp. T2.26MG-112.2]|uniref:ABC transporter permease n=1 Tax=Ciceribacter sp. T2.26MG-112.2 TaxID=3137154 RepID=UPI0012B6AB02|nr:ABC transporter permease [Ciceribacter naphthalenivorans]